MDDPAGTLIEAGTVTADEFEERATVCPPEAAFPLSSTVASVSSPPAIALGEMVILETEGGVMVTTAPTEPALKDAVTVS